MSGGSGMMRMFMERTAGLLIVLLIVSCVGACSPSSQSSRDLTPVSTPPSHETDATAVAAKTIIDSALQGTTTISQQSTDVTPSRSTSVAPTVMLVPSPTIPPLTATPDAATTSEALADAHATTLSATQTADRAVSPGLVATSTAQAYIMATAIAATLAAQPTATPDWAATSTAQAHEVATAIAATLTAQPTSTPNLAATSTAQAYEVATAIAATLTAQPTVTPNLAATQSAQRSVLQTAVAATLTAQPPPAATATATAMPQVSRLQVIGTSAAGRPIEVVEIGNGDRRIIFVGGLHAGSAPSTAALAQQAADYFRSHSAAVPDAVKLAVVLNANPDAVRAPGKLEGRLNAAGVDLNRNWDCEWQAQAKWRDHTVSGGSAPFSEMETQALLNYITGGGAVAVIFWEAKMETGQVSAGGCGERSLVSQPLADIYGGATGYTVDPWAWYPVNGDAANSLDKRGIPAASVLLRDYEDTDWPLNLRGILAVMEAYAR